MHLEKETAGNTYLVYHFLGFFLSPKKIAGGLNYIQ